MDSKHAPRHKVVPAKALPPPPESIDVKSERFVTPIRGGTIATHVTLEPCENDSVETKRGLRLRAGLTSNLMVPAIMY